MAGDRSRISPADFHKILLENAKKAAAQKTEEPDSQAVKESAALTSGNYDQVELQRRRAETAGLHERNRDRRVNRKLRANYAKAVFCYLVCYSIFVGILLVFSGFGICGFSLPGSVLNFLVGSTAASAIGLVFAVTHGLFDGIGKV